MNPLETVKIEIGETVSDDRRKVYYTLSPYGVSYIGSRSRTGKSALAKLLAYEISVVGRKLLIIDPFDEWENVVDYNKNAFSPRKILNSYVVKNFAVKISQLNDVMYWYALGFSEKAGEFALQLSQRQDVHDDDPDVFFSIIRQLPSNRESLKEFNENFKHLNLQLDAPLNVHTISNILNRWPFLQNFFWRPGDHRVLVENFRELFLQHDVLIVSLNLDRDDSFGKVRSTVLTALILKQIGLDTIKKHHPVIISEESDYVVPAEDDVMLCLSRDVFREFARKFQKFFVHLIFISQDSSSMDKLILRSVHQKILGILPHDDFMFRGMDYRFRLKPRQFLFIDEFNRFVVFRTRDCPVKC